MISPEKVIIIIALLFIICVMPFPIGLLMFKFMPTIIFIQATTIRQYHT